MGRAGPSPGSSPSIVVVTPDTAPEAGVALTQLESLCSAVLRAMSADPGLQWSNQTLYQGTCAIPLYAAHQTDVALGLPTQRAVLDGVALRMHHSDALLHAKHTPSDPVERLIYELLEQLRVESLVGPDWPGVEHNLKQNFQRWCQDFIDSGLTETDLGILLFTVAVVVWCRLTGSAVPEHMADSIEATRANLPVVVACGLAALRQHRHAQMAFIPHALALARWVGQATSTAQANASKQLTRSNKRSGFALSLHFQPPPLAEIPASSGGASRSREVTDQHYRVFTRAYDREVCATKLVRKAQLLALRTQIDEEVLASGFNINRLAHYLYRRLALPELNGWVFEQEQGYVDGRRLAQLVCSPQIRSIFKTERAEPAMHCAVTLLLDCSGSMKAHVQPLSVLADTLGRALDMVGVRTEVLGFSTQAWNGGRARRDWQRANCPTDPGRLNEALHLVFKPGALSWRRGRMGLAALRRPDLFRESIDGEAVAWACKRLLATSTQRRILMVVSDGCPMDTATHQCNDDAYLLDHHLQQVVSYYERHTAIEICALGVGLDLGLFYRRRLELDLREAMDEATVMAVADFITCKRGKPDTDLFPKDWSA